MTGILGSSRINHNYIMERKDLATPKSIFNLFLLISLVFIVYYFGALNMRLYFPVILASAGFGYGFY